jgi:IMP cyclohydrolase
MRTKAFDESKLSDPSLIIYNPFLQLENTEIITNGDQTNTVYEYILANGDDGYAFEKSLHTREFEPDHPNYTPRISGILYYDFAANDFRYKMSILKSNNGNPEACQRYFYSYKPLTGMGHFIHTYKCDGNPIPSFYGEPEEVALPNTAEELADLVWKSLNEDNKVSLFVRTIPLDGSAPTDIIINKNK